MKVLYVVFSTGPHDEAYLGRPGTQRLRGWVSLWSHVLTWGPPVHPSATSNLDEKFRGALGLLDSAACIYGVA